MITAIVQSIQNQGSSIIVNVQFSNTNDTNSPTVYTFGATDTSVSIQARIQADLDDMNARAYQLSTITSALATGTVFQTSSDSLSTLKATIDTQNTAAIAESTNTGIISG